MNISTQFYTSHFYRPQRSWGKVIFLHVSVILFTGEGFAPLHAGIHPPPRGPEAGTPLPGTEAGTPPGTRGRHPPGTRGRHPSPHPPHFPSAVHADRYGQQARVSVSVNTPLWLIFMRKIREIYCSGFFSG